MKGSLLGKFLYLFCAMAGVLVGYGIVTWNAAKENIDNTKDNTLIREAEDSVFFVEENEKIKQPENSAFQTQDAMHQESVSSELPYATQTAVDSEIFSMAQTPPSSEPALISTSPLSLQNMATSILSQLIEAQILPKDTAAISPQTPDSIVEPTAMPNSTATVEPTASIPNSTSIVELTAKLTEISTTESTETVTPVPKATITPVTTGSNTGISEDKLPSLGLQWFSTDGNVPQRTLPSVTPKLQETPSEEVITYPAQIFGQVPIINRSDAYVSYFEFAYDLVSMLEPVVEARELKMNSLLTQFVIKALFCGVNIEKLDINAPIPRRLAALCLWLAAQVLNESGCDTSAQSAESYVTDIDECSVSEKKAIVYLYESGILKGYQVSGQRFYPQEGVKTETGTAWLLAVKQCWK